MDLYAEYSDLPLILIKQTPFRVFTPVSFGLITYAISSKKWFLVKRRHTYGFLIILRGGYQDAMLPEYISKMVSDEATKLRSVLDNLTALGDLIFEVYLAADTKEVAYVFSRLQQAKDLILKSLNNFEFRTETEWLWAKGRRDQGETSQMAAIREFEEESGFKLDNTKYKLLPESYAYKYSDFLGRIHNVILWICLFEDELEVVPPSPLETEVADRGWFCRHEASKVLSADKRKIMETVEIQINRYIFIRDTNETFATSRRYTPYTKWRKDPFESCDF